MDVIGLMEDVSDNPTAPWIPFIGAVLAAGAVACIFCQLPPPRSLSWIGLFLSAIAYVITTIAASAVAVWAISAILPDGSALNRSQLILIAWGAAAWLPLLVLLLREGSPWAVVVVVVDIAVVTNTLRTWKLTAEEPNTWSYDTAPEYKFLRIPDSPPLIRRLVPALGAAICAQAGVMALLTNHLLLSVALFGIGSSLLSWQFFTPSIQYPAKRVAKSAPPSRSWLVFLLAIMFTSISLIPYLSNRLFAMRMHAYLDGQFLLRAIAPLEHRAQVETPTKSYSGVILWPLPKKHKQIVPPSPANNSLTPGVHSMILKIPFDGVYWYFKSPDKRPKPDAHVEHGNPMKVNIHSTDWRPIVMEARQNLGVFVDTSCCSQIRVAIQNADNRPGRIALGVILTNTTVSGRPSQFLGMTTVASSHPVQFSINRAPVSEVLNFRIPANARIRQFNEITVLFRPAPERALAGAKIAVQQFMLVPRGL